MSSLWDTFSGRKSAQKETGASPSPAPSQAPTTLQTAPTHFDPSAGSGVESFLQSSAFADPAQLHPLSGLNKDTLEYLSLEDAALNDVPGGQSVLPSRGFTDDLCYGTGVTYLAALSIGGAWGLQEGLRRSANQPPKLRLNSVLNAVTRRGPFLGNSAGVVAITYNLFNSSIGYFRGKHDAANSILAGGLSGMVFKSTRGVRPMLISGGIVASVAGAWAVIRRTFFAIPEPTASESLQIVAPSSPDILANIRVDNHSTTNTMTQRPIFKDVASGLVELKLDNMRARFRRGDLTSLRFPLPSGELRVDDEFGGHIVLSSDTSSPLREGKQYLHDSLQARSDALQDTIRIRSIEFMLSLHNFLDQELLRLGAGYPPRPRSLHDPSWLDEKVQAVALARLETLHAYPLLDHDSFKIAIVHLGEDGATALDMLVWPNWATFEPFIENIERIHSRSTRSIHSWSTTHQLYLHIASFAAKNSPYPPNRGRAMTYKAWLEELDKKKGKWIFRTFYNAESIFRPEL
ncbi:hypothetical protein COL922a_000407 [Colletotrichum nupharicola]|nr:hypothetical protein COL922a_000407 [Colletotrichum nupharicola]